MSKRRKFLVAALGLGVLFWILHYVPLGYQEVAAAALALITFGGVTLVLKEDLRGVEWLTLPILPVWFSLAAGLFYYLLPAHFLAGFLATLLYVIGIYAILLTENIYSVAAIRTIQLLRAAHAVGFLMTVLTAVLLFNAIFSFHWPYYYNALGVFVLSAPLFLQSIWVVKLETRLTRLIWGMSLGLGVLLAQTAAALSFLPVTVWAASLFLGTGVYVVVGLLQQAIQDRLFERTIWEYVGVGIIVFLATLLITPWKG